MLPTPAPCKGVTTSVMRCGPCSRLKIWSSSSRLAIEASTAADNRTANWRVLLLPRATSMPSLFTHNPTLRFRMSSALPFLNGYPEGCITDDDASINTFERQPLSRRPTSLLHQPGIQAHSPTQVGQKPIKDTEFFIAEFGLLRRALHAEKVEVMPIHIANRSGSFTSPVAFQPLFRSGIAPQALNIRAKVEVTGNKPAPALTIDRDRFFNQDVPVGNMLGIESQRLFGNIHGPGTEKRILRRVIDRKRCAVAVKNLDKPVKKREETLF